MKHLARATRAAPARLRRRAAPVLLSLFALACATLPAAAPAAKLPPEPRLDASAWILIDARDGSRIAGAAAAEELPIASATKLMTAYLALAELELDQKLVAPRYAAAPAESVLGLEAGERISVRDLLVALLLPSANDAAVALAEGVSGSVPRFVGRMNRAARRLGLAETSYANPIGLDDPDNHSSARDLVDLALILRQDDRFRRIVSKAEARLKSGARKRDVETRNTLLRADRSVDGIKTGHTRGAGFVLVASAERDGVPLISALLGAGSEAARDRESEELLDYGFSLYRSREVIAEGDPVASLPAGQGQAPLELLAARSLRAKLRPGQKPTERLRAPESVVGPVGEGESVGRLALLLGEDAVGRTRLLAARDIAGASVLEEVGTPVATFLIVGGSILVLIAISVSVRSRRTGRASRSTEERMRSQRERNRRRNGGQAEDESVKAP